MTEQQGCLPMASSTSEPFSIFRFTSNGDTESNLSDDEAIGMKYHMAEGVSIGVVSFGPVRISDRKTDVPNVAQRSRSTPPTGLGAFEVPIDIIINEKEVDQDSVLAKLLKFKLEGQRVKQVFNKGRFGMRNDAKTHFNFVPTLDFGCKFLDFQYTDDIVWGGYQTARIIMEVSGDYSAVITNLNGLI